MKLRIDDLREIQEELDARIFTLHETTREATFADRILALLVETGELANETRCFKYWSLKPPASNDLIFEEFSDIVHFVLSLGIDIGFEETDIDFEPSGVLINDQFHAMYRAVLTFSEDKNRSAYTHLLKTMCDLSHALGMDQATIRRMYLYKNEKNHQRQDEKY